MNSIATVLIRRVEWSSFHAAGGAATSVPHVIEALAGAPDEASADQAYWLLDNHVVVKGQVLDSALEVVPILLALLAGPLSVWARRRMLDLLIEIQASEVHPDELARGNLNLASRCTEAVRAGKWLIYSDLLSADDAVRLSAVDLIAELEDDIARRRAVLEEFAATDPNDRTREAAAWWLAHGD
jgi:hypothetical protein